MKLIQCLPVLVMTVLMLHGCQRTDHPTYPPQAEDILHALQQQDPAVQQVQLLSCQRFNPFDGQDGNNYHFDQYQCQIKVSRYNAEFNQNSVQQQQLSLHLASADLHDWQIN